MPSFPMRRGPGAGVEADAGGLEAGEEGGEGHLHLVEGPLQCVVVQQPPRPGRHSDTVPEPQSRPAGGTIGSWAVGVGVGQKACLGVSSAPLSAAMRVNNVANEVPSQYLRLGVFPQEPSTFL